MHPEEFHTSFQPCSAGTLTLTLDVINDMRYCLMVIKSFACNETEKIFKREGSRRFPPNIQERAKLKLNMIDASVNVMDLRIPPANRLEILKGNRAGQYSIRINQQWRICFRWQNGDAYDVEIVDYH